MSKKAAPAVAPCSDGAAIYKRQQQALVDTVKEARKAEVKRQVLYDQAISKDRQNQLMARFEAERANDEMKITQLMSDLESVKQISTQGHVNEHEVAFVVPNSNMDRFGDTVTTRAYNYHQQFYNSMEKHDRHFYRMRKLKHEHFDVAAEKKKNILLHEKMDVIRQLINVEVGRQQTACFTDRSDAISTRRSAGGRGSSIHHAPSSHPNHSDSSSNASWATFGHHSQHGAAPPPKGMVIPSLNLIKIKK